VFTKLIAYFGEEMSDFRKCWGHFSATEIWAYFDNFQLVRQRSKTLALSDQSLQERALAVSPWRVSWNV